MRKILIAMGSEQFGWNRHNDENKFRDYQREAERLMASAKQWGFQTIIYDNAFIFNRPYYKNHKDVLDTSAFGFAFRPIIIYETMLTMNDGDVLMYLDSNHTIDLDPQPVIEYIQKTGTYFQNHIWQFFPQKMFTPRDTFVNMGCDEERYWESCHLQGNVMGFCKNDLIMKYVTEWKDSSLTYKILYGENKYPNFPEFKERRLDQSVFSILVEKYGFPYVNRTNNVFLEYMFAEKDFIQPEHPIDFSYRREQDERDIR
jgi:hypothetical protein